MTKRMRDAIDRKEPSALISREALIERLRSAGTQRVIAQKTDGNRLCAECKSHLPLISFPVREVSGHKYYDSYCHPCRKLRSICRNLCISIAKYKSLLAASGGLCAVCASPFSDKSRPVIDHCHVSGQLRAVLCGACNTGMGLFRDRPDILRAAAVYCEAWIETHSNSKSTATDRKREAHMLKLRVNGKIRRANKKRAKSGSSVS